MLAPLLPLLLLLPSLSLTPAVEAATAGDWRGRAIYQLLTDRFAPSANNAPCNTDDRRYCGGTWRSIISKLDYISGMGFDAIWISPTAQNLEGVTQYGEAYHGFWPTDPTKLNSHFGNADDLKALSKAVHDRGMLLMVDIAINALASTTTDTSDASLASAANGQLLFKHQANYHPSCDIQWGNQQSEQTCWLANSGVMLMDLNQDNDEVRQTLLKWAPAYVSEYGIDGFRLDASKHMTKGWQHDFCSATGVFCMGEIYGDNTAYAASFQGADGIDAVFGFGVQAGFIQTFTGFSPSGMQFLADHIDQAKAYSDPSVIGAFLDNQDLPRINALQTDKKKVYNAFAGTFLYGGIPLSYYGTEQDIADGDNDPRNREALWLYNNYATDGQTYQFIKSLNQIRKGLSKTPNWGNSVGSVVGVTQNDIALKRGDSLIVLTNRGDGATGTWTISGAGFGANEDIIDLLSGDKLKADGQGAITVTWTSGQPFVLVSAQTASAAGLGGSSSNPSPTLLVDPTSSESPSSAPSDTGAATSVAALGSTAVGTAGSSVTTSALPGSNLSSSQKDQGAGSTGGAGSVKDVRIILLGACLLGGMMILA